MRRTTVVGAIGIAQTLAWGSSYYLPAILAEPIAASLRLPSTAVFAAFSGALFLSALLAPTVGRAIDQRGGRIVLTVSNAVLAIGLGLLSAAHGVAVLAAAWAVLGVGMTLGLYDAAFATLAGLYGRDARAPITGVTLIAGFASTVGWPLSALLAANFGWRGACLAWAAMHLLIGLPLHRFLVPQAPPPPKTSIAQGDDQPVPWGAMPILAFVFAAAWFVTGGVAAHLPRMLEIAGATPAGAIVAAALVGPAQVAARIFEFSILRRVHPMISARLAVLLNPLGAAVLSMFGAPAIAAFALLHGAGNGMITIAKGTLPLAIFGPAGYGRRTGVLGAPARATQAFAPLAFGLLLDHFQTRVVTIAAAIMLAAFLGLLSLKIKPAPQAALAD